MDLLELDEFLRKYSFIEEYSFKLQSSPFRNNLKFIADSVTFSDADKKKIPFLSQDSQIEALIDNSRLFVDGSITNPGEGIIFSCHPRFVDTPEHHHPCVEMVYIYSGQCNQIINGNKITMIKGEICLLDPNVSHSIEQAGDDDIIINFLMSKNYIDNILINRLSDNDLLTNFFIRSIYQSKDFNNYILFKSSSSDKIKHLIEELLCAYLSEKPLCLNEIINSYMILIFAELLSIHLLDINENNYDVLNNTKISDILLYVENNYKNASVISTADYFHFHPNYLSKIVKKITGQNFTDIVHKARLKKACILLKNSNMPIAQISNEVGYSNINFFYKIFKRYFQCTPSHYRDQ